MAKAKNTHNDKAINSVKGKKGGEAASASAGINPVFGAAVGAGIGAAVGAAASIAMNDEKTRKVVGDTVTNLKDQAVEKIQTAQHKVADEKKKIDVEKKQIE